MDLPKTLKLGWRTYDVEQGEHRAGSNGGDLYGEIDYEKDHIFIYDKLTKEEKEVTLLHEIAHYIFWSMGKWEIKNDEALITGFAEILYQIMRDNPQFFKIGVDKNAQDAREG